MSFEPTVIELAPAPPLQTALEKLAHLPGCLLLQSAMQIPSTPAQTQALGRYSFLMADPIESIVEPIGSTDVFSRLKELLERFKTHPVDDLPPMQGGLAGLFSYELSRSIENLGPPIENQFQLPAIAIGAYDVVIAWDHQLDKAWIISQGFPAVEPEQRRKQAEGRANYFRWLLELGGLPAQLDQDNPVAPSKLEPSELEPSVDVAGPAGLKSNFTPEDYIAAVQKSIDYVNAGDVFQVNLAQRLSFPADCSSLELYHRLTQCNPAPFSGYFDLSSLVDKSGFGNCPAQIISASPERLFSVRNGLVETRPIKGTRRRTGLPEIDRQAKEELLASEKDRAENTMIVDLMRNDLSKVCQHDSVAVTEHCTLEEYESVFHLVSAVQGQLKPEHDLIDLLKSVFPGGSITGAPKIRAMEIIAELEPNARGAYCGGLGYLGFDGNADINILIRTITAAEGWWQFPVGGGIVTQSQPAAEHEETWTKAAGMLRAINKEDAKQVDDSGN